MKREDIKLWIEHYQLNGEHVYKFTCSYDKLNFSIKISRKMYKELEEYGVKHIGGKYYED